MLVLESLTIRHGSFALSADLALAPGSRTALIGPSGAGKSTLLLALAGFLTPQGGYHLSGRILWNGAEIGALPPADRPIAMLFQDQNLFPHLSLAANLGLALTPRLRLTAAQGERVVQTLSRLGLQGLADRKPGALSGGQQARAALGRVLLQDRPILLLDEPFAALGPGLRAELLDLVAELAAEAGQTLIMVTHDPQDALRLCPETSIVAEGRVTAPQPTAALLADPPPILRAYLGQAPGGPAQ